MFDRKEYYKKTRNTQLKTVKDWRGNNSERYLELNRARYRRQKLRDPRISILHGLKARAKKKGILFDLTKEDIVIPSNCPVLGIPLQIAEKLHTDNSPSVDRIDATKGYVKGNIAIISWRANRIKCDGTLAELEQIVQ